jgi:hypoxanthine phosphoribosyltransferase
LSGPVSVDFVALSSYATGTNDVRRGPAAEGSRTFPSNGRHVLIIEDIVDTGLTLAYLQDILRARNPRSLRTALSAQQAVAAENTVTVDYVGFESTIALWWVTGWTTRDGTGTCPISGQCRSLSAI